MTKKLNELSLQISEDEYRKLPCFSYSSLSEYLKLGVGGLSKFGEKKEASYFTFGGIVDSLITGNDDFDSKYVVRNIPSLTAKQLVLANCIMDAAKSASRFKDVSTGTITDAMDDTQFYPNWKIDTRLKAVYESPIPKYCDAVWSCKGRQVITTDDYKSALKCRDYLYSNATTGPLFKDEGFDRYFQLKFRTDKYGVDIRCMFDMILVDHDNKKIIPCDLKTTGKYEYEFIKSYYEFNYWLQANLYSMVLQAVIEEDEFYKDYKIEPFMFIVINKDNLNPIVFIDESSMVQGDKVGRYGKKLRNWVDLAKELDWQLKNRARVRCPKEIYDNNFIVRIENIISDEKNETVLQGESEDFFCED